MTNEERKEKPKQAMCATLKVFLNIYNGCYHNSKMCDDAYNAYDKACKAYDDCVE